MFCPKCHTELDDSIKFCSRCGEEQIKKKYNTFSSSNTFKYLSKYGKIKNNDDESHEDQYEYSKDYSNIKNEVDEKTHLDQYNYNKNYSKVKKEANEDTHQEQYSYNQSYSKAKEEIKTHSDQYEYSTEYSNQSKTKIKTDKDYITAFAGEKYKRLFNDKISIPALIFGPMYLLYRKLYFQGILSYIILIIITTLDDSIGNLAFLIFNIYIAVKFKEIYFKHIEKKVYEIKTLNQDKSSNEIIEICKRKGNTLEIKNVFIIIIIITTIIIPLITLFTFDEEQTINTTEETTIIQDTIKDYTYNIPNNINNSNNTNDNYKRYYINNENTYCSYTISINNSLINYPILEKYINNNNTIKDNNIQRITYNNINWLHQKTSTLDNTYVFKENNDIYILEFKYKNEDTECINAGNTILNSFKKNN